MGKVKFWIEPTAFGTNQGKYIICCDKTRFSREKRMIIGRIYQATLTDEELEEVMAKIKKSFDFKGD